MTTHTDDCRFNSQPSNHEEIFFRYSKLNDSPSPVSRTIQPSRSLPNIFEHDSKNFPAPVNERTNRPRTASAVVFSTPPEIAVTFANSCLVRSYERRSQSFSDASLTRSFSNESLTSSRSYPSLANVRPSSAPTSAAPRELSPIVSEEQSTVLSLETFNTTRLIEKLLNDVKQVNSSEEEIKRQLTMIKIQYYRQRCKWAAHSLNKSMDAIDDSNHSSELATPDETETVDVVSATEPVVEDLAKKTMPIDTVFSKINILFALYEDVISNLIA